MHILKGFWDAILFNVTMNTMQAWRNTLMFVNYVICLKKHKNTVGIIQHSTFSHTQKVGNSGINANFVFPDI